MTFHKTNHCRSRLHCRTCRSREAGRTWRTGIARHYGGEIDFDCPAGLPWDHNIEPQVVEKARTLADDRIADFCGKCENYQKNACQLYRGGHCSSCNFKAYLNRPGAICPAVPPRFV